MSMLEEEESAMMASQMDVREIASLLDVQF